MASLQEREAEFHNRAFASDVRARVQRYWAANQLADDRYNSLAAELGGGRRVLEYGCGQGSLAFTLAKAGSQVLGIDISEVAIAQAQSRAVEEGVEDRTEFRAMDAMSLDLPDDSFDFVCGSGILHHLELDQACAEIRRVMRPGAVAVFSEPLGHNPALNFYRRRTPNLRTPDEHPLLMADIDGFHSFFERVDAEFFTITTLLSVPIRRRPSFRRVVGALNRVDQAIFGAAPFLRRYAWVVILRFQATDA